MSRRGENIYKRKDGRWEGRYIKGRSPDGKAQYGYVYARSYQEVRARLQRTVGRTLNGGASRQRARRPRRPRPFWRWPMTGSGPSAPR